jgi:hypothetical protein
MLLILRSSSLAAIDVSIAYMARNPSAETEILCPCPFILNGKREERDSWINISRRSIETGVKVHVILSYRHLNPKRQ